MALSTRPRVSRHLSDHRAVARASVAAIALTVALIASARPATQAGGLAPVHNRPTILPEVVATGIATNAGVVIDFDRPMDPASVTASALLVPEQPYTVRWSPDGLRASLEPGTRWRPDQRYMLSIPAAARLADGSRLGEARQFSFTTQAAPRIVDFQVRQVQRDTAAAPLAGADGLEAGTITSVGGGLPADTAQDVSAGTAISIAFSAGMDRMAVARALVISPHVAGTLRWEETTLVFIPAERLASNVRYALSLAGARDRTGNLLAGDTSFSFTTRPGAQIVRATPAAGAANITDGEISIWFSQPMDADAVTAALIVTDVGTGAVVSGSVRWNAKDTRLAFTPSSALAAGHRFEIRLGTGSADADGNPLAQAWSFTTRPVAVARVAVPAAQPPPSGTSALQSFALNQINASRAAYGFAPLTLSSSISAVAYAHALDMLRYGYFSHTGRDGSTPQDRLRRAGISFGYSGENICSYTGISAHDMLDWCHTAFMTEAYPPPPYNHKSNILSPDYRRVGIGIAQSGSKTIVVWDFTD